MDLGNVGVHYKTYHFAVPVWVFPFEKVTIENTSGTLSGTVTESNTNRLAHHTVYLYHRPTGRLISKTTTNSNGDFEFRNLPPNISALFFAVCKTDDYPYNAVILDKLTAE